MSLFLTMSSILLIKTYWHQGCCE